MPRRACARCWATHATGIEVLKISLIVAASSNGVIGSGGTLPWHLPDDFRYFKAITMGKPIVMGRRTWESIGRALPGRMNIVLTRQLNYVAQGATVVDTPDRALAAAGRTDEVMVIGGESIYRAFLSRASRIYLTRVETVATGDVYFEMPAEDTWQLTSADTHEQNDRHAFAFQFRVYDRLRDGVPPPGG